MNKEYIFIFSGSGLMKKAISVFLAVVMVFSFAACSDPNQKEINKSVTENVTDKKVDFSAELTDIPEGYKEKVKSGSLPTEEIEYDHDGHTKKAVVYLPPNYDAKKLYNVLYIIPGYNGNHTVIFGNAGEDTMFKNVLDNMISNGDIEPMIAVTPDFYTDSKERLNQNNFDYLVNDFKEEVTGVLIPTVESKYSTYAKSTSKDDLIASREHRAFAGCSMGGAICWELLATETEYFYYYAPTAAGSFEGFNKNYGKVSDKLRNNLKKLNYTKNDYFVFGTDGTKDVTYDNMQALIKGFKSDDDLFTFTDDNKSEGNITYKIQKGGEHKYKYMYKYLYNALLAFFEK